jgi:endo-1,4-beta-xylanase
MQRRDFLKASLGASVLAAGWPLRPLSDQPITLRDAAQTRNILAGSAISNSQLHNQAIAAILAEQCSIVVAGNEMKWDHIHPEPGRYDFKAADELGAFAAEHGLALRGHNLCWHEAQPDWLASIATRENAAQILEEHIRTVAGRYAGRMHSWDVVNEAVDPGNGRKDGMRESLWFKLLGTQYIAIAFLAAAQADPKALLTYNDFGLEGTGPDHDLRRAVTLGLLRWMRHNNIPIHALGLQSHLAASYHEMPDWTNLNRFLREVAKLDLQVFVTELDVDDNHLDGKIADREKESAWLCKNYLENILKHPHVKAVLTWGLVNYGSYGNDRPNEGHRELPFDESLKPSPFLTAMVDALQKH